MFGSEILDVAIGVVFVFLLVSLFASSVREGIEGWLKTRATHLEAGIRELLHDPTGRGLTQKLFDHPLIYSLYSGKYSPREVGNWPIAMSRGRNLPAYIPSRNFALALLDLAARGPVDDTTMNQPTPGVVTLQTVRANLSLIQNPPVQRALLTAIDTAEGDLRKAQANIEAWYDSTMDRVSGWYKRATQWFLFGIGFALAVALNVNAITIGDYLYRNKTAREIVVARAQNANADHASQKDPEVQKELDSLQLPIGGTKQLDELKANPFTSLGGWLLTAVAASLGAPFWFDLLNKFMVVRSTVKPHQKSPEESSEDSQVEARRTGNTAFPAAAASPLGAVPTIATHADAGDGSGSGLQVEVPTNDKDVPASEGGIG